MRSAVSNVRVALTMCAVLAVAGGTAMATRDRAARMPRPTTAAASSGRIAYAQQPGQQVFEAQKCTLCHSVAGKGNAKGPLDGVGSKYSAADLKLWITNPAEMGKKHNATRKPPMKSFASLAAADIDALVAYLQTLK
jgi:mono/diheme cytochrome c family protein